MAKSRDSVIIALLLLVIVVQGVCLYQHLTPKSESYCDSDAQCPKGQKCSRGNCVLR